MPSSDICLVPAQGKLPDLCFMSDITKMMNYALIYYHLLALLMLYLASCYLYVLKTPCVTFRLVHICMYNSPNA